MKAMKTCRKQKSSNDQKCPKVRTISSSQFKAAWMQSPVGEEGGASFMVKEGALKNPKPDTMFAIHCSPFPSGKMFYTPGPAMASSEPIRIDVNGMGVHGSTPWMGK